MTFITDLADRFKQGILQNLEQWFSMGQDESSSNRSGIDIPPQESIFSDFQRFSYTERQKFLSTFTTVNNHYTKACAGDSQTALNLLRQVGFL